MRKLLMTLALLTLAGRIEAQATSTKCKDGTSSVATGRGACSGHGGVDAAATAAAAKAAKATAKAEKTAAKAEKKAEKATDKVAAEKAKADKAETAAASTQVTCTDGAKSAGGRGACSGHGGIAKSNPVEKKAEVAEKKVNEAKATAKVATAKATTAKAAAEPSNRGEDNNPVGAIAKCKDGMYSHAANRRGACSRHGGVASWT